MIKAADFIHPEDAAAIAQLESVPGLSYLMKKYMEIGYEVIYRSLYMSTAIRLSPTQYPELYNRLPPICQKLGIEQPDFYLVMNPYPNACTFGDTHKFIAINTGLLEELTMEEVDSVIAHECGHIICRHTLYHNIALEIFNRGNLSQLLGQLSKPIVYALYYWMRKSELSCDRCAAIVTSPEMVASTQARLAGASTKLQSKINLDEWISQADDFDKIDANMWNKLVFLQKLLTMTHPMGSVRVREILKWGQSDQYKNIMASLNAETSSTRCPECGASVQDEWLFCQNCGMKL